MDPRGGSRAVATSKMERFLVIVNGSAVNYYHKAFHLGCCNSPRSASGHFMNEIHSVDANILAETEASIMQRLLFRI